jgi:tRNA-2-methylthio-N6-dimethylallyladenosine synthase
MVGKTPWLQSVHVMTDAPVGAMLDVDLMSAGPNSLAGEIVREMEAV